MDIIHSTLDEGYDFITKDRWGRAYHFKISTFDVPSGLLSEAIEVVEKKDREPYLFLVLNDYDEDIEYCELLLKAKIKKGINKRYLKKENGKLEIGKSWIVRGRIEWDDDFSDTIFNHYFVVDGKRITIEQFVKLLSSFEGFHFRFSIQDPTDEEPD